MKNWLLVVLLFASAVQAQEFEYMVVMVEKMDTTKKIQGIEGAYMIPSKTRALNSIAAQGWEIMSVVPGDIATERVYLRRPVK